MRFIVTILSVTALIACGEGVQPDQREVVYFTAVETDQPDPQVIEDPGPVTPEAQLQRSRPIVNGFVENQDRLLAEPEIQQQIGRLERIFMATGDYHKFIAILRNDYDKRGAASYVADRYAWTLIRMGQRKKARQVLDELLMARAADANIQFLDGAFWLQAQPREDDDVRKTIAAWKKTLELDPSFSNYDVTAELLQAELQALEQQVGSAPPQEAATGSDDMKQLAEALVKQAAAQDQAPDGSDGEGEASEETVEGDGAEEPKPQAQLDPKAADPSTAEATEGRPDQPPPAESNEPRSMDKNFRILVAKGQIALSQGNYDQARQNFVQARAIKPNAIDPEFGQLQAEWGANQNRNQVANRLRRLAERPNLTPEQRIELGTFLWTKMARKDLATKLFEAAKSADPSSAAEVDGLLEQMAQ